jgi:formylglycine-generating enzyme required for sulfatase activity
MRHQVTVPESRRCVEAGACRPAHRDAGSDRPVVGVSWRDAADYAAWLSHETGRSYRLPTDEEWAYAAGGRFRDDGLPPDVDADDPGQRALARYEREAQADDQLAAEPQPVGHFGSNENGLLDIAGNIWEWTSSCFVRGTLDVGDEPSAATVDCGVRVVEGRHRTYLTDIIRDARAGGCAVGTPPANLGFRLVWDDADARGWQSVTAWMRRWL